MLLKKSNKYIFQQKRQELLIRYLMLNDSGKYSCRADNPMGTNETYQQIIVKNIKCKLISNYYIHKIITDYKHKCFYRAHT